MRTVAVRSSPSRRGRLISSSANVLTPKSYALGRSGRQPAIGRALGRNGREAAVIGRPVRPRRRRLHLHRGGRLRLREDELAARRIDTDRVAVTEAAFEQLHGEWILDEPLNRTLERSRTERRVPADFCDQLLG